MLRGEVARRLDPFTRSERLYAEDLDLYQRVRRIGTIARLDESLLLYRQHTGGISKRFQAMMYANAEAIMAERHAALAEAAPRAAALLVRHVMGGEAVPDRVTLTELGLLLGRLQSNHLAAHRPEAATRRLI